ncbi:MAG: NACHT domain-containing protein [Terriglobales bacterium]
MGDLTPKIEISADALVLLEQKFLGLFDKDDESIHLAEWFRFLQATALKQTASVQCVGMRNPLPFESIYQPTRIIVGPDQVDTLQSESFAFEDKVSRSMLRARAMAETSITIGEFLQRDEDALIFGGPGWGKTTFLHNVYRLMSNDKDVLPVLFTLRRPTAIDDLEKYVEACERIKKKQHRACSLLLVDGYDEVNAQQRQKVSEALLKFQAGGAGKFYLTCRDYYQVSQVKAPEVRLDRFTREDQVRFVGTFLSAFGVVRKQDADVVVTQLEQRGFTEFLEHPLLLTLACIITTTSTSVQPRSAMRLLEFALDVLCLHWDEQKNIGRQASTPLDGRDRKRILKNIAYRAKSPFVPRPRADEITRKQLALMAMDHADPREVLLEIARFYGILTPAEDGYEFVHRTIHDFLAAQQWVESGDFAQERTYEWSARTGYAACLVDDATHVLKQALAAPDGLPAATEIIGNYASFDFGEITNELTMYFAARVIQYERGSYEEAPSKYAPRITGQLDNGGVIRLANSRFLKSIVDDCCCRNTQASNLLVAYAVTELYDRREKLDLQIYEKAVRAYKTDKFTFVVPGVKQAQLGFLNPVPQNRLKDYARGAAEPIQ